MGTNSTCTIFKTREGSAVSMLSCVNHTKGKAQLALYAVLNLDCSENKSPILAPNAMHRFHMYIYISSAWWLVLSQQWCYAQIYSLLSSASCTIPILFPMLLILSLYSSFE